MLPQIASRQKSPRGKWMLTKLVGGHIQLGDWLDPTRGAAESRARGACRAASGAAIAELHKVEQRFKMAPYVTGHHRELHVGKDPAFLALLVPAATWASAFRSGKDTWGSAPVGSGAGLTRLLLYGRERVGESEVMYTHTHTRTNTDMNVHVPMMSGRDGLCARLATAPLWLSISASNEYVVRIR